MQDIEIVELYWKRDEAALTETQSKYDRYLNTIAYNILADREDSIESVNDTYMAAWNSMPPNRPAVLSAYLGKITRRFAIDIFRKKNSLKRRDSQYTVSLEELAECVPAGANVEDVIGARELAASINTFLKGLGSEARNVFVGRYYFMDSVKDIAGYCGIRQAKVKSLLFQTRKKLRSYLEKEGFEV